MLRCVAAELNKTLRAQDICARWGGEEFLIMLPNTDLDGAVVVSQNICDTIRNCNIDHEGKILGISITLGTALLDVNAGINESINRADAALNEGKKQGRDRVQHWQEISD